MSKEARDWAYAQPMRAPCKPVLVALAEHGACCWPSLNRLAEMTGYDVRTVRRAIRTLEQAGFIAVQQQPGRSARYHLLLSATPDRVTEGAEHDPGHSDRPPRTESPPTPDRVTGDPGQRVRGGGHSDRRTEKNRKRTEREPPPQGLCGGGGSDRELVYPEGLSALEQEAAAKIIARHAGIAQALLDELAALMQAGQIRVSPLACLRGLARRAAEGTFHPDAGIRIAEARRRRRAAQAHIQQASDPPTDQVLREHARMLGVSPDEYVRRFMQ